MLNEVSLGNSASSMETEIIATTSIFEHHPKSKAPLEKNSGEKEASSCMAWPEACVLTLNMPGQHGVASRQLQNKCLSPLSDGFGTTSLLYFSLWEWNSTADYAVSNSLP